MKITKKALEDFVVYMQLIGFKNPNWHPEPSYTHWMLSHGMKSGWTDSEISDAWYRNLTGHAVILGVEHVLWKEFLEVYRS